MADSFVDVTYRGLEVGRRLRIRDFTGDGAYVEAPTPMPVGTSLAIAVANDGGGAGVFTIDAIVARVHEQVGGSDRPPGMGVRATIADGAARAWWDRMIVESPAPRAPVPAAPAEAPIEEIEESQARTQVMAAVDVDAIEGAADAPVVDDGKRTQTMSTVEIEAIIAQAESARAPTGGDDESSVEIEISGGVDEDVSQDGPSNGANGAAKSKSKKPRRRRSTKNR